MLTTKTPSRANIETFLKEEGLPEEAVALIVRATSHARQERRVRETTRAAESAVAGVRPSTVILLDLVGVGGHARLGVQGSTCRLPCFQGLGKGRKQASDGGAWMTAAETALRRLCAIEGHTPNALDLPSLLPLFPDHVRNTAVRALALQLDEDVKDPCEEWLRPLDSGVCLMILSGAAEEDETRRAFKRIERALGRVLHRLGACEPRMAEILLGWDSATLGDDEPRVPVEADVRSWLETHPEDQRWLAEQGLSATSVIALIEEELR